MILLQQFLNERGKKKKKKKNEVNSLDVVLFLRRIQILFETKCFPFDFESFLGAHSLQLKYNLRHFHLKFTSAYDKQKFCSSIRPLTNLFVTFLPLLFPRHSSSCFKFSFCKLSAYGWSFLEEKKQKKNPLLHKSEATAVYLELIFRNQTCKS